MSELGDLLVLLHGARGRSSTVRATVRTWHHPRRAGEAMARTGATMYAPSGGPERESVGVRGGRCDPHNGAISNADEPDAGSGIGDEYAWLLDPAAVIGLLDFDAATPGRRAGRDTLRVRAVPRRDADSDRPLARLGAAGADELQLEIDAERGTLLRVESRLDQEPFAVYEVLEIAFDEEFPDDTFVFTPPPGEPVRTIADQFTVRRELGA